MDVFEVIEVPFRASDAAFARAVHRVLRGPAEREVRQLSRSTRKLPYYRAIENTGNGWVVRNQLSREGATIHIAVNYESFIEVDAFAKNELVHQTVLPPTSDLADVVAQIRKSFEHAENPPKHRFRFGAQISVFRADGFYFYKRLCVVNGTLYEYGLDRLPVKSSDQKLGAALLEAMTAVPYFSDEEAQNVVMKDLPVEVLMRSVRGELFWNGAKTPKKLSFWIIPPYGGREPPTSVPANAKPAAIGKLVRTAMAAKTGAAKRGISHEQLFERLVRLEFFEFSKRTAATRREFLKDGWAACIEDDVGRFFHADAEDLAEGGVGEFLASLRKFFAAIGLRPGKVRDELREDGYDLHIDGKCYPILVREDFEKESDSPGHLWGIAGYRTAGILNQLLRAHGRKELAYCMEGGNDLAFLFITPEMHAALERGRGYEKRRGPYRAKSNPPSYGLTEY